MRLTTLLPALALLGLCSAAHASPTYTGSIELRSPAWNSALGGSSGLRNLEIAGDLKVAHLLGPVVLCLHGEHTFHQTGVLFPENKFRIGGELPLAHNLTAFTYYDQRYSKDLDRVFVGVRLGFSGGL